jgi:glycosyltransferase involved in cell wall biosynthesis
MSSLPQKTTGPLRIALLGLGLNSYLNPNLEAALRRVFPGHEIDWIDVERLVRKRSFGLVPLLSLGQAIPEFTREMGPRLWQLKRRWRWTSYLSKQRSLVAAEMIARRPYLFSLQTQSTFAGGVPGVPHFVYTDNTLLANLQYKDARRSDLPVSDEWLALERQLYHSACACFVMSRNVGRSLLEDYGCAPDRVICAYGGYNAPVEDVNEGNNYEQRNILFVGIDWERKGGPDLVEAFRSVRRQIPDATLTIVGCSPSIHEPGCHVVGRVPPSDLGRYYANASVFCMPTRHEPFGIVFLEAMAHKLAIVATEVGAIPDFVSNGDNGFGVSPGDIKGLADRLVRVLRDPELCRRMGERSFGVSKTYTWDNTASIMRGVIERFVPLEDSSQKEQSLTDGGREALVGATSTADIDS